MAFIKGGSLAKGTKVKLTQDVKVLAGTFERGTIMTVTGSGPRGLDFIDDEGNELTETIMLGDSFYTKA